MSKRELAVRRFAKVLAALGVSAAAAFVVGPDFADVVGTQYTVILAAILTPILSGLEKGYFKKTS